MGAGMRGDHLISVLILMILAFFPEFSQDSTEMLCGESVKIFNPDAGKDTVYGGPALLRHVAVADPVLQFCVGHN